MKTLIISLVVMIGIILAVVFKSPLFLVKDQSFKIDKAECVNNDQLKKLINLNGGNIFSIDTSSIEKRIKSKFSCVRSVSISKQLPSRVEIGISGREPKLVVIPYQSEATPSSSSSIIEQVNISTLDSNKLNDKFLVDDQDQVYAKADSANLPNVILLNQDLGIGKSLGNGIASNIVTILAKLKELSVTPKAIFLSHNYLLIEDSNPAKTYFSLDSDIGRELASLQLILQKSTMDTKLMDSVDLRFNKPVVVYSAKK